jgi:hypothetical protein
MAKSRPKGGRPPRSRRPGRAGVGPGPAYRPSRSGGGTGHKSSSATRRQALAAVVGFIVIPAAVVLGITAYLAHGYGLI